MPSGGQNKISRDELLRALADLRDELGETPRLKDWREHGEYSAKALYNEFENWNAALDELDMEKHHVVNKERLTFECDGPGCDEIVDKLPSDAEASERHYCSQECHYAHKSERFSGDGNPQSTLKTVECYACSDEIERAKWERERYERDYCAECWGQSKQTIECDICGTEKDVWPSHIVLGRRFCSYKCMGEWRSQNIVGKSHPRFKDGRRPEYYGPNWPRQRRASVVRDQARCQDCGLTESESIRKYSEHLSVHYTTPFREFVDGESVDYESANELGNLVTLCRSCHSLREGNSD